MLDVTDVNRLYMYKRRLSWGKTRSDGVEDDVTAAPRGRQTYFYTISPSVTHPQAESGDWFA